MIKLNIPLKKEDVVGLKVGDRVLLSGIIFTARDMAHKFLFEEVNEEFKDKLKDGVVYHCGPIVRKKEDGWEVVAAGPTTSAREEPYEGKIISEYSLKAVIGKGGMGSGTLKALSENGCVYLHAVGGAAVLIADSIVKVRNVYKLEEFGIPEAIWELEVKDFPAIVTMDAHGNSLHDDVLKESEKIYKELIE